MELYTEAIELLQEADANVGFELEVKNGHVRFNDVALLIMVV